MKSVATEADSIVNGDRRKSYGSCAESFSHTAQLWSAYLKTTVTAKDVAHLMTLFKISRDKTGDGKRDNKVDAIGYQICAAKLDNQEP